MSRLRSSVAIVLLILWWSGPAMAGEGSLRKDVSYLASEACAGREVGTEGHDLARDYIIKQMEAAGLEPAGTDGWLVPVQLVRSVRPRSSNSLRIGERVLARGAEYQIADFSDDTPLTGQPVFAGYGLHAPQVGWNDYTGLDVRGRIVVMFTGAPPSVVEGLPETSDYLLSPESKAAVALGRGAAGVLFVLDPRSHGDRTEQREDALSSVRPAFALDGITAGYLTARVAAEIFGDVGLDLAGYQETLDAGGPRQVELSVNVTGQLALEREVVTAHNVIGKLPGAEDGPPVVIGAHYDHLGLGGPASLYDGAEALHPGADDNASGVGVMLEVARKMRGARSPRTLYFAALTGEEHRLRGSRRLARVLFDRYRAGEPVYLNMDMVGRLNREPIEVFGVPDDGPLRKAVSDAAAATKVEVEFKSLHASYSDHLAFADFGWPSIGLSTGRHADYHQPSDTLDRLDWRGLRRVAKFVRRLSATLVASDSLSGTE